MSDTTARLRPGDPWSRIERAVADFGGPAQDDRAILAIGVPVAGAT